LLWEFNRFLPEKTGILAKMLLLMLIDVALLAAFGIMLPPAPLVVQGVCSEACVYTRASVRRASGFVLTAQMEVIRLGRKQVFLALHAGWML
jgi:hypothetical protein